MYDESRDRVSKVDAILVLNFIRKRAKIFIKIILELPHS